MKHLSLAILLCILLGASKPKPDFPSLLHNLEIAIDGWRTGASDNGYNNTITALQDIAQYDTTGKLPTIIGLCVCCGNYLLTLQSCGTGLWSAPCVSVAWANFVECCGQYGYVPGLKEGKENE